MKLGLYSAKLERRFTLDIGFHRFMENLKAFKNLFHLNPTFKILSESFKTKLCDDKLSEKLR